MLKHVMVTLDGSQLAEAALPYAQSILAPGGKLTLISVLDIPENPMYTLYEVPVAMPQDVYNASVANAEKAAREYLSRMAANLKDRAFEVTTELHLGDPAAAIIDQAKTLKVDAIVMSTHGRSGFSRWLFGSITQKVLAAMPCPVFVIPGLKVATSEQPVVQSSLQPA